MDCCAGEGRLWRALRAEFSVAAYLPLDLKPARGRLACDSRRMLATPGWTADVVDIDTYGHPWGHWVALLATCDHDVTVFLTVGRMAYGSGANLPRDLLRALGIPFRLPPGLALKMLPVLISRVLALALTDSGWSRRPAICLTRARHNRPCNTLA